MSGLSDVFFLRLAELGTRHGTDPTVFLDVWNSESGLRPSAENPSSHARGLNQMMPFTLKALGAPENFHELAGEAQLPWIERLISEGERLSGGPFRSAERYYHSNFFPRTLPRGQEPATVVVTSNAADPEERAAYAANRAMDGAGKGRVTYADLTALLERAKRGNRAVYDGARARLALAAQALQPSPGPVAPTAAEARSATPALSAERLRCASAPWQRGSGEMASAPSAMRRQVIARTRASAAGTAPARFETGRLLPRFVTPTDVRDLKNRIDPFVRALDTSVGACAGLPTALAQGWSDFSKAWRGFFDEDDSWLHTAAQMDQAEAYQSDVARWQETLSRYACANDIPPISPTTPRTLPSGAAGGEPWSGTVKTVAIAGAVIASALALRSFVR
jgi:hypothetical protein